MRLGGVDSLGRVNDETTESLPEQMRVRREKLDRLRESGIDPYPVAFPRTATIAEIREKYPDLEPGSETGEKAGVAGRVIFARNTGKLCFATIRDGSGDIQIMLSLAKVGEEALTAWKHDVDLGDHVGVEGEIITSRRGELSVMADRFAITSKCLRPLPEKHAGLTDPEARVRYRYVDLIVNDEAREMARLRSATVRAVRDFWHDEGYLEVETPMLQPIHGGATARPFKTHINAYDMDLYLRIAIELYLKRLVVGGIDRVYELGKDFRNEGVSHKHNPEFTMLEWYEAYADYEKTAHDLEMLVAEVAERVLGTTKVKRGEVEIDWAPPWRRITLREAILERAGIDILEHPTREALVKAIGTEPDPKEGWGKLVDGLLSKEVEPGLIQPTFIFDYPVELSPFAKAHRSEQGMVERWEAFAGGVEIANSFTELNDPDEQRRRFEQQAAEVARGDEEAQPFDEAFVEALEQGMPPTGGVGLGIDRLVMMLTGAQTLREVLLFPAMRR